MMVGCFLPLKGGLSQQCGIHWRKGENTVYCPMNIWDD